MRNWLLQKFRGSSINLLTSAEAEIVVAETTRKINKIIKQYYRYFYHHLNI